MKILVFDIGGTAIKYGICKNGHLEETKEYPTEAFRGGTHILNTICRLSEQYLPFDAIGISTAGQVNPDEGSIIYANSNIPDYTGTQFKKILQKLFHVPVAVENDVNSAALGEAVFGAGKGKNSFLCLTYGTGVGGAIIENKQVYHGSSFSAGEFGAIITHAEEKLSGTDPFDGCYERYASATALVKMVSTVDSSLTNGRQIFASLKRPEINEVINKWIDEGYDVFIVSDCCNRYQSYRDKLKWLKTYIPKFDLSHFIPCKEKYVIQGDILIDDNLDNLNKWSLNNPYGHDLLMTAQHNKQIQDERRINSFKEADDYIKTIQFLMSVRAGIKALEK